MTRPSERRELEHPWHGHTNENKFEEILTELLVELNRSMAGRVDEFGWSMSPTPFSIQNYSLFFIT